MASRAYWKGHIRLSLVSFPVFLYPAIAETNKVRFHQYYRKTGERIHYEKVTESGKEVLNEDIVKGYEYEKDQFVPIEEKDLEKIRLESKHTIDLAQFVDENELDPIYFDKSYFVVPDGEIAQEAYLTIKEALRTSRKNAIGQIILNNKERIVCLRPCSHGLILDTLRYAYEIREAERYFEDIPRKADINKEQLKLAKELIDKKTFPFNPRAFKDHYEEGLREIIATKLKGKAPKSKQKIKTEDNVINIMDALKKSLKQTGGKTKKARNKGPAAA